MSIAKTRDVRQSASCAVRVWARNGARGILLVTVIYPKRWLLALQPTKPANASEAQFDSRLFGTISSSIRYGYNEDQVYDKSLFAAREAVQSIVHIGGAAGSDAARRMGSLSWISSRAKTGLIPLAVLLRALKVPVRLVTALLNLKRTTGGFAANPDEDPFGVGQMISEVQQSKKYGLDKPNARESSPSGSERDSKRPRNN